jgi:hypothetical protein
MSTGSESAGSVLVAVFTTAAVDASDPSEREPESDEHAAIARTSPQTEPIRIRCLGARCRTSDVYSTTPVQLRLSRRQFRAAHPAFGDAT